MILLDVRDTTWEDYVASLSETARKNLRYVEKHNKIAYYGKVDFDRDIVEYFMRMWEDQPIRGVKRQWAFPVEHIVGLGEAGKIKLFRSMDVIGGLLSVHFVQMHEGGFAECHPPMWKKTPENERRYLAKYMWFNLVKYAIADPDIKWLDFGGGDDYSWRDMIRDRKNYPNPRYKWMYIPDYVKEHPESQPDFTIVRDGWERRYIET